MFLRYVTSLLSVHGFIMMSLLFKAILNSFTTDHLFTMPKSQLSDFTKRFAFLNKIFHTFSAADHDICLPLYLDLI